MKIDEAIKLLQPYKVWVLAPLLESEDANINYYYDFTQSIQEYTIVFQQLEMEWQWTPVTINNYKEIIEAIPTASTKTPLILNLCDGDEVNGTPGISVVRLLEQLRMIYTGSDEYFYSITTSKIPMKRAFDKYRVPHANWRIITEKKGSVKGLCKRVGTPLIIKPAVSGGSMGVSVKNVIQSEEDLSQRLEELRAGYRGWNLLSDGIFAEQFITGREFTTFITGSADDAANCKVYEPVERVFHPSLPDNEKFLSFDRLWEIYESETPMPANENFYDYHAVEEALIEQLKSISMSAYKSCKGKGYGRLDIRMSSATGTMYVLEVNAQCGLSEDEDHTSIGAILRISGVSYTEVIADILKDALRRSIIKPVKQEMIRKKKFSKTIAVK